jgi:hypothetical protein
MDRFIDYVMPEVPGCPQPLIKQELLRVAISFCTDSWIWQLDEEHEVLDGNSTITLTIASGQAVTGCQLSIDGSGFNEYTRSAETVTLDDARTADTTFDTTVFLKPTRAATALPDILYNDWFEAIEAGAISNLMLMPKKKWFNSRGALLQKKIYLHGLGEAKIKARKTNSQTRLTVHQRIFV